MAEKGVGRAIVGTETPRNDDQLAKTVLVIGVNDISPFRDGYGESVTGANSSC
jgi:hypothetical protein